MTATTAAFDADIGMWCVPDNPEDPDTALAREAEALHIQHRAAAVAQAVADEVAAIQYDREPEGAPAVDWVEKGRALLGDIVSLSPMASWTLSHRKRRINWHESGSEMMNAPWGILLSTSLPLGVDWLPEDMIKLRSCCYSLRANTSTSQFLLDVLATLGVHLRPHVHDAKRLFHLASRIFAELTFIHSLDAIAANACGLRRDDVDAANLITVAGSHALSRMLLLQPAPPSHGAPRAPVRPPHATRRRGADGRPLPQQQLGGTTPEPPTGIDWTPGDIDVFVACRGSARSKHSMALFKAVVDHAKAACYGLYRAARLRHPPFGWSIDDHLTPKIDPQVKTSHNGEPYSGLGGHPSAVVDALEARGASYERDSVLAFATGAYPPALVHAIGCLPPSLGMPRPLQIERVAEVLPFQYPFAGRSTSCSYGNAWPVPMKINVIQYYAARDGPPSLTPLELTSAFDILTAGVTMRVRRDLHVEFTASAATRRAVAKRELRLTNFAFGPAREPTEAAIEEAISKQIHRIFKYEAYGFKLPPYPPYPPAPASDGEEDEEA